MMTKARPIFSNLSYDKTFKAIVVLHCSVTNCCKQNSALLNCIRFPLLLRELEHFAMKLNPG